LDFFKCTLLIFLTAFSAAHAGDKEEWLDEVDAIYENKGGYVLKEADPAEFGLDNEQRPKIVDGYVIPPLSPELRAMKEKTKLSGGKQEITTKYYKGIRPGDKLPDDVYECVLDHVHGIGSDVAAQLVWQSCLRLQLK